MPLLQLLLLLLSVTVQLLLAAAAAAHHFAVYCALRFLAPTVLFEHKTTRQRSFPAPCGFGSGLFSTVMHPPGMVG